MMTITRCLVLAALALALPVATGGQPSIPPQNPQVVSPAAHVLSPLVDEVRGATVRFKDINVAVSVGWVQETPCVSGPNFGAMGVHVVLPVRIANGVLSADQPEGLIYEPMTGSPFRLVGVEFIVLSSACSNQHPGAGPPALEGHLLNFVDAPNCYGLPPFYELHVWAWEEDPVGSFADWNTRVSCDERVST